MPNELRLVHATPSLTTIYAIIRDEATLKVWDGTGMVTWVDANIDNYDIALSDQSGDLYTADAPANLPDNTYRVSYYLRAGGSPATTDTLISSEVLLHSTSPGVAATSTGAVAGLTKLDGVNIMLEAIGSDRVSILDTGGSSDAGMAEDVLDTRTSRILSEGWHCNTEHNVTLVKDGNGQIQLGTNVLRVDADAAQVSSHMNVCRRGNVLYNIDKKTDIFTDNIRVTQFLLLNFVDLTPALKEYIARSAAVDFQRKVLGSSKVDNFVVAERDEAKMIALAEENDTADHNILKQRNAREILGLRTNSSVVRR